MANDSSDPQVKIGATIDPTGANAGAAQVVKDVNDIESATGKAAEGGKKLVENLGSLRTAHHAIAGIGEIAKGGTEAIAGMSMEVRFLGEAFEALIPGFGPILIALTTVLSLGSMMVAKQEEHNKKLEEGKDKTDGLKDSTDELKSSVDTYVAAAAQGLKDMAAAQKAADDQFKTTNTDYDHRVTAMNTMIDRQKELTDLILKAAEAQEIQDNKGGAEGAEAIHEKYASLRQTSDSNSKIKKLNNDMDQVLTELRFNATHGRELQDNHDDLQQKMDALKQRAADARDALDNVGVAADKKPGEKGEKTYDEAIASLGTQQQDMMNALAEVFRKQRVETVANEQLYPHGGPIHDEYRDQLKKQADDLIASLHENARKQDVIKTATDAQGDLDKNGPDTQKQLDAANEQIAALTEKTREAVEKHNDLLMQLQSARQDAANAQAELAKKNAETNADTSDKDFESETQAQVKGFEDIINDKSKPAADREAAARKAGEAEAAILQRKKDASLRDKDKPPTQGELDEQDAAIASAKQKGIDRANEIATTETKKDTAADNKTDNAEKKELEEAVREATQLLNSSGDKGLIESFKKYSAGMDLQQRAASLIADLASKTDEQVQAIEARLQKAENAIRSGRRNFQH